MSPKLPSPQSRPNNDNLPKYRIQHATDLRCIIPPFLAPGPFLLKMYFYVGTRFKAVVKSW